MLYLVPTPLGNLKDITLRALETLKEVDLILCEDTRTSSKLLQHYEISKPLSAYHQHNEHKVYAHLVDHETLPGATAFVPALVNSGIPSNRFVFEGFLPLKKGRQTLLKKLAEEERTIILYESPVRLVKTLEEFIDYFGAERYACVSRELTKIYEEHARGTLTELVAHFKQKSVKGEIVVVISGKE
ncbi:MAG: rRNA ((1402)-2-O)-methyltransferase [Bacteroidota bacterium]